MLHCGRLWWRFGGCCGEGFIPPFEKGGLGGISRPCSTFGAPEIPLNPPFSKGEALEAGVPALFFSIDILPARLPRRIQPKFEFPPEAERYRIRTGRSRRWCRRCGFIGFFRRFSGRRDFARCFRNNRRARIVVELAR